MKKKKGRKAKCFENNAIILDYLPDDNPKFKGKPIAQAIGTKYFSLLELTPKKCVDLEIQEKVYIGKGKREKIERVLGKINGDELTKKGRIEIDYALEKIVNANEQKYVDFFNNAVGITLTLHQLGSLPGMNSTKVYELLKERDIKKFDSFEDITNRVPIVKNPQKNIVEKIKEELRVTDQLKKHILILFTKACYKRCKYNKKNKRQKKNKRRKNNKKKRKHKTK